MSNADLIAQAKLAGGYQMDQLEEMTDAEIDSVLGLHDRRRGNIFRFPERRASENDRRSLERWFAPMRSAPAISER